MDYRDTMAALSPCGIGAALLAEDGTILALNETGSLLLSGENGPPTGRLADAAPALCEPVETAPYQRIAFRKYVRRCPAPQVSDLPDGAQLITFRDATDSVERDQFQSIIDQTSEAVMLCDEESRICCINDATVRLDSVVASEVVGEDIRTVYFDHDTNGLLIPAAIQDKTPKISVRQHYRTKFGREVDIVSNNFPILKDGQLLGGFSLMEDWTMLDRLHKQVIDLQDKLTALTAQGGRHRGKSALTAKYRFQDITHVSGAMHEMISHCKQAARSDSSVMIYGETGTGKELVAQSLHNASRRANGPFLAINCAALPENLLEGLLFGTERGAYTGAESRAGLFEQANYGTLLLDELNSMSPNVQSKLLRVLQDGMIRRVGGSSEVHVDVRVLSNINIPPQQAIAEGKLRQDLFYRLGVVNVSIPPLRERKEDIPLLAKQFIIQLNKKLGKNVADLAPHTLGLFWEYDWPGNVRELQHVIEHTMNLVSPEQSTITPELIYLPSRMVSGAVPAVPNVPLTAAVIPAVPAAPAAPAAPNVPTAAAEESVSLNSRMRSVERETICKALRACGGNVTRAAQVLKMSRQNLQYRIKRYQIDVDTLVRDSCRDLELF